MSALAEHVSRHGSVARAAKALKIGGFRAEFLWLRIVARLGPQADSSSEAVVRKKSR